MTSRAGLPYRGGVAWEDLHEGILQEFGEAARPAAARDEAAALYLWAAARLRHNEKCKAYRQGIKRRGQAAEAALRRGAPPEVVPLLESYVERWKRHCEYHRARAAVRRALHPNKVKECRDRFYAKHRGEPEWREKERARQRASYDANKEGRNQRRRERWAARRASGAQGAGRGDVVDGALERAADADAA